MNDPLRTLRVLADEPAPAAWNMAVDEALLALATEPTLRLYGWSPQAVSLGYFQRFGDFADLPPGTPLVRRLTGGGAICHGDELTFALVVDAALLPVPIAAGYTMLHDAIAAALADVGVRSERCRDGAPPAPRPADRWCFAAPGRDDLVTARGKLLGSAQRRVQAPRPRVLHHGSLVLQRPALTPFVAAVADTPVPPAGHELRTAVVRRLAAALDLEPAPGSLLDAERQLATRLRAERYEDPAFLRRC